MPNCIKVDKISIYDNYVAIDSLYNTYSFSVSKRGQIMPLYENGEEVKWKLVLLGTLK